MVKATVIAAVAFVVGGLVTTVGGYLVYKFVKKAVVLVLWLLMMTGLTAGAVALVLFQFGWFGAV